MFNLTAEAFGDAVKALNLEVKGDYEAVEVNRIKSYVTQPQVLPDSSSVKSPKTSDDICPTSDGTCQNLSEVDVSKTKTGIPADPTATSENTLAELARIAGNFAPMEAKNDGEKLLHITRNFYRQTGEGLREEMRQTALEGRQYAVIQAFTGLVEGNRSASSNIQVEVLESPKFKRANRFELPSVAAIQALAASEKSA